MKLKIEISKIGVLSNKKWILAYQPYPLGIIKESRIRFQIALAELPIKSYKRVQSLEPVPYLSESRLNFKLLSLFALLAISISVKASDLYKTTSNLNIRSGPGTSYDSIDIIKEGDSVIVLENTNSNWVKIEYDGKIGYSSRMYLTKIETSKNIVNQQKHNYSIVGLLILAFTLSIILFLNELGKKHRNKSFATLLALLFGTIGLHRFYLGQITKGILFLLFCWTFIPLVLSLVDFFNLLSMPEEKFNYEYNGSIKRKITAKNIENEKTQSAVGSEPLLNRSETLNKTIDNSIIDVNAESSDLRIENDIITPDIQKDVPYWHHMYIYSYDDIKHASKQQKEFYDYFRNCFIKEKLIDIQGNTNYAFILYFELLNDYEKHKDIKLLERQFKLLGACCPKTKSYSLSLLMQLLSKRTDSYSLSRLKDLQEPSYRYEQGLSDYNPDAYKLGGRYKNKLGLNKQEIAWLNKFWDPSNVFLSIEGCCIATIVQYLHVLKELNRILKRNNTSVAKEVVFFKEEIKKLYKDRYNNDWGYYDVNYLNEQAESEVYLIIFKRVENSVREAYRHKRKVSEDLPYTNNELNNKFEERIGVKVNQLTSQLKSKIAKPDISTQIELNAQNVNRWKDEFSTLKNSFQSDELWKFTEGITLLEEVNQKNPNIENIFFDASKFMAKYDRVIALKHYAKYIFYDLQSKRIDGKQLTKTIQKSLFQTEEQLNDYRKIIDQLTIDSDINKALHNISKIYVPKRKKIVLNKSEIEDVEQKHSVTVELLNEYLESDEETELETKTHLESSETDEVEITFGVDTNTDSLFNSDLKINEVQEQLIRLIAENSFAIHKDKVEKMAVQNGMFKNQLIDSINEKCFEILDGEALIEEDEETYIMEEFYYREIAK